MRLLRLQSTIVMKLGCLRLVPGAGAGRMGAGTQYTVNNQMVNATLMNIADNPTNVQLPGVYKNEDIPRVPVVCTGAPLALICTVAAHITAAPRLGARAHI